MDKSLLTADRLAGERRMIASDTVGIELQLINRHLAGVDTFGAERTLLMMHGATYPSESLFDVPAGGTSFMDALARAGYDVWAVDARGYGGSTRLPEMTHPPEQNPPLTPARVAVRDLRSAADFIRKHRGVERLNVLGMSWGATVGGAFAAEAGDAVAKLVLVTPLWLSNGPRRIDPGGALGAYRIVDVAAHEARWRTPAPAAKRASLIPDGWFDLWKRVTLATDPGSPDPGTIRAPSGAVQDVREHWTANNPLYDPANINCPVLIITAEWDVDVPLEMAQDLFVRLVNARSKRLVEIGEGTHMVLMEKNRRQAFDAVIDFLDEDVGG